MNRSRQNVPIAMDVNVDGFFGDLMSRLNDSGAALVSVAPKVTASSKSTALRQGLPKPDTLETRAAAARVGLDDQLAFSENFNTSVLSKVCDPMHGDVKAMCSGRPQKVHAYGTAGVNGLDPSRPVRLPSFHPQEWGRRETK